jgi:hypothetical protein
MTTVQQKAGYMIVAALVLIAVGVITLIVVRGAPRQPEQRQHFIPSPRGPVPVSTDEELLAARDMFPPVHATVRADGLIYCGECGEWTDPLTWEVVTVTAGNKVTDETPMHNCARRAA